MAFTTNEGASTKTPAGYAVMEKLYLSKDGARLVAKTDPDVGSLYAHVGMVIPLSDADRLGLIHHERKESKPAETKEARPQATKRRKRKVRP